jgi:hypothetical protein
MSAIFDDDVQTLRGEMAQLRKACARLTETVATTARDGRREAGHLAQDALHKIKTEAASAVHDVAAEVDARPLTIRSFFISSE